MGDRGQVNVKRGGQQVFLYTHWSGSDLPDTLRRALARRQRWDDAPYLARIIFSEMVKGQEAEETGFGIWAISQDTFARVLVVDVDAQTVDGVPFADYIKAPKPTAAAEAEEEDSEEDSGD
jgi:hypothetical protein